MQKMISKSGTSALLLLLMSATLWTGCEGFFGKKVDSSFIDVPVYNDRQVAYVPIQPVWDGFVSPSDVTIGYDELVYIVDAGSQEIVCYDQAGAELGRYAVPGLKEVAQDRSLDLLAVGTFDTLINGNTFTLSTIYRLELKSNAGYGLKNAVIENKVVHPFYYKVNFSPGEDDQVEINDISVRANNSWYIARSGPTVSQIFGPDDAIVLFNEEDDFQTAVRVSTGGGVFNDYFRAPVGVTTLAQPPQSPFVDDAGDFVFCSASPTTQIKVQYIDVLESDNGIDYTVRDMPVGDTSKADGFLYTPGRFASPADVTYSGDGTNYIFVVDSEKDSLYQFTNTGLEGVAPPPGSNSDKNIKVSFGGTGTSLTQFNSPTGIAYYRQILYVADRGNQRVLRFKLTTDFD